MGTKGPDFIEEQNIQHSESDKSKKSTARLPRDPALPPVASWTSSKPLNFSDLGFFM